LWGDALGFQEHVDGGCVMALLGIGAAEVEADLAPAARQAGGHVLKIDVLARFDGCVGIAKCHGS